MAETEHFALTTRHGQRLVGLVDEPPGTGPVARTLVLCHGYGGDKDGRYLRQIAATVTEAGGAVVRFDFTNGAGESDGTLRDASVAHYADDLDDVLDFVATRPRLAASAVNIGGHSYAGMVVLAVAGRRPGLAAVFFLSAVYNRTNDFDMPAVVARITAPIVIIAAGADREVSSAQADALARDAGPKVIARHVVDGADHNFTAPGTAARLAALIRDALPADEVGGRE
jgi:pimeloyl-ACP methyl ester carboxylesterase